jgi:hypothetical protein
VVVTGAAPDVAGPVLDAGDAAAAGSGTTGAGAGSMAAAGRTSITGAAGRTYGQTNKATPSATATAASAAISHPTSGAAARSLRGRYRWRSFGFRDGLWTTALAIRGFVRSARRRHRLARKLRQGVVNPDVELVGKIFGGLGGFAAEANDFGLSCMDRSSQLRIFAASIGDPAAITNSSSRPDTLSG